MFHRVNSVYKRLAFSFLLCDTMTENPVLACKNCFSLKKKEHFK